MLLTANALQTVAPGGNVLFTEEPIPHCNGARHRAGSGLVSLSGKGNQCRARYKVDFAANIAVVTGGTAGPISIALSLDGEPLASTTAIVTPAAAGDFFSICRGTFIDVPFGSTASIALRNTSTEAIDIQNASLTVVRTA